MGFDFTNRIDHHRAVTTNKNQIVVAGGVLFENYNICKTGEATSEVSYFDFDTKSWVKLAQMMERRCAHALVVFGRYIYAIGGKSLYPQGDPLPTMECYNIDKERWEYASDLPMPLCHHQAFTYKKHILVVGGVTAMNSVSRAIYQYTPSSNMWETYSMQLEQPRAQFGATLLGDQLYICGGWNGLVKMCTMEVLDLDEQKLRRGGEFHEDRISPALFVYDGEVYLCGGLRTLLMPGKQPREVISRDLWKYNAKASTWHHEAKLLPYANSHAFAVAELNIKKFAGNRFCFQEIRLDEVIRLYFTKIICILILIDVELC